MKCNECPICNDYDECRVCPNNNYDGCYFKGKKEGENIMSDGIKALDNTVLTQFLGAEGVQELRSKTIDMIVDEIHQQLKDSSEYIVSPDDIANELYSEIMKEVTEEVKEDYKKRVVNSIEKLFSKGE